MSFDVEKNTFIDINIYDTVYLVEQFNLSCLHGKEEFPTANRRNRKNRYPKT